MGQRECAEHFWARHGQKPIPRLKAPRPQRQSDDPGRAASTAAPLGLAFDGGAQFPAKCKSAAFMALHGSWNRALHTGSKVVRLAFKDGKPTGVQDFVVLYRGAAERLATSATLLLRMTARCCLATTATVLSIA
jgi:hypothetical protein